MCGGRIGPVDTEAYHSTLSSRSVKCISKKSPPALKCLIWSQKVSSKLYLAAPPVRDAWKDRGGGSGTGWPIPNCRNTLSPRYHSTWSRYISSTRARKYRSDIATAGLAALGLSPKGLQVISCWTYQRTFMLEFHGWSHNACYESSSSKSYTTLLSLPTRRCRRLRRSSNCKPKEIGLYFVTKAKW